MAALGAVPIKLPSTELYEAASRGTGDAMMFPLAGLFQYDLNRMMEYIISGVHLGTGIFAMVMSEASLAKHTDEQRKIVVEEGSEVGDAFCAWGDNNNAELNAKLGAQAGFEVIASSDAEMALFKETMGLVADSWLESMKTAGKPGDDVLAAFKAGLPY